MTITCPYCHRPAKLVHGNIIYPHRPDLFPLKFWDCRECDAFVGCHRRNRKLGLNGDEPKGSLANAPLRKARMAAHAAFDPIWRSQEMSRNDAYAWLAGEIGVSLENMHIGMLGLDGCAAVVAAVASKNRKVAA